MTMLSFWRKIISILKSIIKKIKNKRDLRFEIWLVKIRFVFVKGKKKDFVKKNQICFEKKMRFLKEDSYS